MFSRESKIEALKKVQKKSSGSTDGDLKADYKSPSELSKKESPQAPKAKEKGPYEGTKPHSALRRILEKVQKDSKVPKIKIVKDEDVGVTGNNQRGHKRNMRRIKVEGGSKPYFEEPNYEQFGNFEKAPYYSDYHEVKDTNNDDLNQIMEDAKKVYDSTWEKPFTLDQSAQDRTGWEDALHKAIWSVDDGKYQSKIENHDYQYMLEKLMEKKSSDDKVQKVIEQIIKNKEGERVEDKNTAEKILSSDPQFKQLDKLTAQAVLEAFLHRDGYLQANPDMWPALPENVKVKKASDHLIDLGESVNRIIDSLNQKKAQLKLAKKFRPEKDFGKLFGKKKTLSFLDLAYNLRKNYKVEEEEVQGILDGALEDGILSKEDLDHYAYQGGFGSKYNNLLQKGQTIKNRMDATESSIARLEKSIEEEEKALKLLRDEYDDFKKDFGLERLYQVNKPEYTKKVFNTDIQQHLNTIVNDGKERSYILKFIKQDNQYKPIFELTLFNTEEGIDVKTLKKAAVLFKQRLERLMNSNFGYIDFNIKGDGIVQKDEDKDVAFTKVELNFDIQIINPKQIETVKNEIGLLINWLDDHFIA